MLFLPHVLALFSAVQPLARKELKEFDNAFDLLRTAHAKGRVDIVGKYGPEVLGTYDLIQIQCEPGDSRRDSYDSLARWVDDAKVRLKVVGAVGKLDTLTPSVLAATIAQIEGGADQIQDTTLRIRVKQQSLAAATRAFGKDCPLDTLFKVRGLLPASYRTSLRIDARVQDGIDQAFRNAINEGADALAIFSLRFPGEKTAEVESAVSFAQIDETNALLRSNDKEGLIKLYKGMDPGPSRTEVAGRLEKILYADWHNARIHDAEVRAAKDFLEVFKGEKKKSPKFKEVESWLYYNASAAPVVRAPAPAPVPAQPTPASGTGANLAAQLAGQAGGQDAPGTMVAPVPPEALQGTGRAHVSYGEGLQ